jgi:hypothetical protein
MLCYLLLLAGRGDQLRSLDGWYGLMPLKKLAMREVRLTYRAFEGLVFPRLLTAAPEGR